MQIWTTQGMRTVYDFRATYIQCICYMYNYVLLYGGKIAWGFKFRGFLGLELYSVHT